MKKKKISVVFLGTGFPFPDPKKSGPSVAILVDERVYIVDAGVGAVRRFQEGILEKKISGVHQKDILEVLKDSTKLMPEVREYLEQENHYFIKSNR